VLKLKNTGRKEAIKKRIKKIIQILKEFDNGIDRQTLCEILKLPRTTVYDTLKILEDQGFVEKVFKKGELAGRPRTYWLLARIPEEIQ